MNYFFGVSTTWAILSFFQIMPELVNPIQEVLDEAGLKADDISKVILFS